MEDMKEGVIDLGNVPREAAMRCSSARQSQLHLHSSFLEKAAARWIALYSTIRIEGFLFFFKVEKNKSVSLCHCVSYSLECNILAAVGKNFLNVPPKMSSSNPRTWAMIPYSWLLWLCSTTDLKVERLSWIIHVGPV